jgi:phosphate starvation-inducible membrane PsiE
MFIVILRCSQYCLIIIKKVLNKFIFNTNLRLNFILFQVRTSNSAYNTIKNLLISYWKKSAGIPKAFPADFAFHSNFLRIFGFQEILQVLSADVPADFST